jgi:uncharacterized protein
VTLDLMPGAYAICRLDADAPLPDWATRAFSSITRTADELSILCALDDVPAGVRAQRGHRGLAVRGPLDFSVIGILAQLSAALAAASISIFVVSTYDTDYLFVRNADLDRAIAVLRGAGHAVVTGVASTERPTTS